MLLVHQQWAVHHQQFFLITKLRYQGAIMFGDAGVTGHTLHKATSTDTAACKQLEASEQSWSLCLAVSPSSTLRTSLGCAVHLETSQSQFLSQLHAGQSRLSGADQASEQEEVACLHTAASRLLNGPPPGKPQPWKASGAHRLRPVPDCRAGSRSDDPWSAARQRVGNAPGAALQQPATLRQLSSQLSSRLSAQHTFGCMADDRPGHKGRPYCSHSGGLQLASQLSSRQSAQQTHSRSQVETALTHAYRCSQAEQPAGVTAAWFSRGLVTSRFTEAE